jgi:hypothetical protein
VHCVLCGIDAPTKMVSFHQNIGMLVTRQARERKGELCRRCARSTFLSYTLTTLFLGWWGVISFCVTPFMILGNISSYMKCLSLPEPTISAMNVPMALHDVSSGVTRGLTLKIIYGTIVWGTIGVLALQNSPQFLDRYSPRLSSYLKSLGLVEKQAPGNVFGMHTLPDGTVKAERIEHPDGEKDFDITVLPDGTFKKERIELPDGEKWFEMTRFQDGTEKVKCVEFSDGEKDFDMTRLPDGTQKVERVEFPDGEKHFDTTVLPDGTKKAAREEFPDGEKHFDITDLPDGTEKVERAEFPGGEKDFDITKLPDSTYRKERVEFPDGKRWFEVTRLQDGTEKVKRVEFSTGKKRFDVTIQRQSDNTSTPKYSDFATWKARQSKSSASDPLGIR